MPYVNIKITRDGATAEQKARLIRGATDLLVNVLGKNPASLATCRTFHEPAANSSVWPIFQLLFDQ